MSQLDIAPFRSARNRAIEIAVPVHKLIPFRTAKPSSRLHE